VHLPVLRPATTCAQWEDAGEYEHVTSAQRPATSTAVTTCGIPMLRCCDDERKWLLYSAIACKQPSGQPPDLGRGVRIRCNYLDYERQELKDIPTAGHDGMRAVPRTSPCRPVPPYQYQIHRAVHPLLLSHICQLVSRLSRIASMTRRARNRKRDREPGRERERARLRP